MSGEQIEIRELSPGDEAILATAPPREVFDDDVDMEATRNFLADPSHHIVVALDDAIVVGFISAVHYHHPDKMRPELWINEVGVAATHRGRGIGRAMMGAILDLGRRHGCDQAWVLTDRGNEAANRLYASVEGALELEDCVMYTFTLASSPKRV
ncbi:MAG TPA: GNAT family N-acetyltransferase [Gemmatimonadaceae bacterium]|nr:GNAT family N-acetyltransferase [Gemmatimonadaceae bacterium]